MLKLQDIHVTLGQETMLEREILAGLNLEIKAGELVVLLGANGAGKSTLMNTISGRILVDKGTIIIDGQNVTQYDAAQRAQFVAQVAQNPRVATSGAMTIEENMSIAFMRGKHRMLKLHNTAQRRTYFRQKLSLLNMGLEDRLDDMVHNLSGGQRQALSLIMALVTQAKILLLDEITAALDHKTAELVMNLTVDIVGKEKLTTLMITHNMEHALRYGDRTLILNNGVIAREYTKQERSALNINDMLRFT